MKKIWPYLIILLAIVVFLWPNLTWPAVNITPQVGTNDLSDLAYPFRKVLIESFQQRILPLWSSKISSGYPVFAEGQIAFLSPLNFVAALLPLQASINFTLVTNYFLLGLFTFLYLRQIKLSQWAALFGAVSLTFCGFAINQLVHFRIMTAFALMMGQLWLLEKFLQSKQLKHLFLALMVLALQFLGGHPQIILYSLIFLGGYFFLNHYYLGEKKFLKTSLLFLLCVLLATGIALIQLWPTFEFTRASTRAEGLSSTAINRYNFSIKDLKIYLLPFSHYDSSPTLEAFHQNGWPADEKYSYVGILPLILALLATIRLLPKNPKIFFFLLTLLVSLLVSFGGETFFGAILLIPPFNYFRVPLRLNLFTNLSIIMLASLGFEDLVIKRRKNNQSSWLLPALLVISSFINLYLPGRKLHPPVKTTHWFRPVDTAQFLRENLNPGERVINEYNYYPTLNYYLSHTSNWGDPEIFINYRQLLPVFNNLLEDIPMITGVANSGGLKIKRYNDLEMYLFYQGLSRPDRDRINIEEGYLFITRLLGGRFLLATQKISHPLLKIVYQTNFTTGQDQVYVHELTDYFPRTFMVPKAETATPEVIKDRLIAGDFNPKQLLFLEEELDWGAKGGFAATALMEKYEEQEIIINTQASGDGFLFLSDPYFPGWKAYVDGEEQKIYRANYAFRAVPLSEGKHQVIFRFQPESLRYGSYLSLIFLLITLSGGVWAAVKKIKA